MRIQMLRTNQPVYLKYLIKKRCLICAIAILTTLSACQEPIKNQEAEGEQKVSPISNETRVQTFTTSYTNFEYNIQCSGKIQATNQLKYMASTSGLVAFCNLKNDVIVAANALLIKLNTAALELKMQKTKENIFSSKLNYQSDLLSQESLLKNKSKGIKDTVYRKLKANVGLTNAELELKDLELELSKQEIRAPFMGKIASVNVKKGMYIKDGEELFTIYTHNDLFLEGKILETDIGFIKIGQAAEISLVASSRTYKARVAEINPIVDENGLVTIKIQLIAPQNLLPGMNAIAVIKIPEQKSIVVPKQAVVRRNGRSIIFTLEKKEAIWNYVTIGRDNGKELEVLKGIKAGQKVIVSNNLQLGHHAIVKEDN